MKKRKGKGQAIVKAIIKRKGKWWRLEGKGGRRCVAVGMHVLV